MQLEFFDIPSPCIGICESDDKGHCLGCMRSRDERQHWKEFSTNEKQKVIKRCLQRKKRKQNKKLKAAQLTRQPTVKSATELNQENELDRQPSLLDPPKPSKTKPTADVETNIDIDTDIDFSDFEL
ncbi:DUF1289 domain-containing protein [Colwellia ponticola]|uniref:DUF1289 domain-containing protein n=1 Tax=Colwellia ponticola TaxID=2304625 RepID=A0A8H2PL61_9GAMM|nr:DUF1289 domain-containing protein [Colwellia ponticola]TMM47488.1 DUF1289 domain-containing protein [Colwellia ponticola]